MTGGVVQPLPPFADWPVQHFDERLGFVWYAEPAAFVLQAVVDHGSVELVERYNDLIDRMLDVHADAVHAASGLFIFHDWRTLSGYDKAARTRQIERMRARKPGYARRTVVVVSPKSRLLRMAVEAVNLVAALTSNSKIELVTDAPGALSRSGIEKPGRVSMFPRPR
jgi:hypothetical protein